jgi:cell division protein FtsQ
VSKAIARGSRKAPARKAPARRKNSSGRAAAPSSGLPETVRRFSSWILIGMMLAVALAALFALRVPQAIGGAAGEAAAKAGFTIKGYEIKGLSRMKRAPIDAVVGEALRNTRAEALIDLQGLRAQLLQFGWVKDARVSRRLPNSLVIDIVERKPAAVWQHNQRLALIDGEGVLLEPVPLDRMPDLPLIIGPGANLHSAELDRLLAATPHLKPALAGASWVGDRRWDLRFQTGEVLALPEGEEPAVKALARFARMDQSVQLLGKGYVRIDMRDPKKMAIRLSRDPGSTIPEIAPAEAQAAPPPRPAAPTRRPPARGSAPVDTSRTI